METKIKSRLDKEWQFVKNKQNNAFMKGGEKSIMPTYEYACKTCHKKFSVVQTIAERDKMKVSCPKCKSRKVDQMISSFTTKTGRKS